MGYWNQDREGNSLILEDTGLTWGDKPADIMDKAVDEIIEAFERDLDRLPLLDEVKAGLLFSLVYALEQKTGGS